MDELAYKFYLIVASGKTLACGIRWYSTRFVIGNFIDLLVNLQSDVFIHWAVCRTLWVVFYGYFLYFAELHVMFFS